MPVKRKKPGEEREGVAVASTSASSTGLLQRGKVVRVGLSLQAKRELLQQKAPQYRNASAAQKKEILNTFTRSTGYHRKYAMRLLNHPEEGQPAPARPRPRQYGAEVQEVLVLAWEKMNCFCAKRLVPGLAHIPESTGAA